jgi:hypothetical protein
MDDVPAGRYRAVAWHLSAGADTTVVTVGEGRVGLDFDLTNAS